MALLQAQSDVEQAPAVISKAVVRAARELSLSQSQLATILGISAATASRLFRGSTLIATDAKGYELAILFLRLYRDLSSLFGGNMDNAIRWLNADNQNFSQPPVTMIQNVTGFVHVIDYLDAMRGHE